MAVNLKDPTELQLEFDRVSKDFRQYHDDQQFYLDAYQNNLFWPDAPNSPKRRKAGVNFLQIFADKLWFYLQPFPKISVPPCADDREQASMREKVLLATHEMNQSEVMWNRQAFDAVMFSCFGTAIEYDLKTNFVELKRIEPRRAVWQKADANSDKIQILWYVEPMTKEAIKGRWGVTPTGSPMTSDQLADYDVSPNDGEDYFSVVTRVDDVTRVKWAGGKLLMTPHQHMFGTLPASICLPLTKASYNMQGDFYLRRLTSLQADFNELWRQRMNIVRKLGNPTIWGRGIKQKQFQPVKDSMALDGGFVGLAESGELGLLTVPETKMIDTALNDCFQRMKDVAGFPTATFGEIAGANTSGDALGMYFQPTTRMIDSFNTAIRTHWQVVNAMIMRAYETFMPADLTLKLYGSIPRSRYMTPSGANGEMQMNATGGFYAEFNKTIFQGNYRNVVTCDPPAPKDDQAYKTLLFQAASAGLISKSTFFDEWGFLSPEDQLKLLETEAANPLMNPQGHAALMTAANGANQYLGADNGATSSQAKTAA